MADLVIDMVNVNAETAASEGLATTATTASPDVAQLVLTTARDHQRSAAAQGHITSMRVTERVHGTHTSQLTTVLTNDFATDDDVSQALRVLSDDSRMRECVELMVKQDIVPLSDMVTNVAQITSKVCVPWCRLMVDHRQHNESLASGKVAAEVVVPMPDPDHVAPSTKLLKLNNE